jgi:dTDP-4-dehydrorhamnose 3,5-epimerase
VAYAVRRTALEGVLVLEPQVFADDRGFLFESFNNRDFEAGTGVSATFVQDNHSRSKQGVLRGLHYQVRHAQGKLVRVVQGRVFDVAVNVKRDHPQYGQWIGVYLDSIENKQLWMPPGFAHGFVVLSETADLLYKTTDYYSPADERCIRWDDPTLAINWPMQCRPLLSAKDALAPSFAESTGYFIK